MKRTIIIYHNGKEVLRLTKNSPIIIAGLWEGFKNEAEALNAGTTVALLDANHNVIETHEYKVPALP